jgi:SPP1 gp7 family putative phage head morphogenesis protein
MPDIPEDPTQSEWLVLDLLDKLNNLFDRAKKDLVKIIDPGETKTSTKPLLQQQLDQVDNIFKTVNLNGKDIISPHMSQSYEHGQMYAAIRLGHSEDDIQRATWKKVGGHVIEAQSNFKGLTDDVAKNVRRVIANGITNEQTVKQISKDIRDQVDMIGKNRADMIARTETMKAVNVGVKDKYRSAGIEVVRWLATIQPGRTCEECKALNGKLFPIDKTPPIPKHPRCRCTLSPVPDPDWSEVEGWDGEKVTPPKKKETSPKEKKKEAPEKLPIAKTIKEANEVAVTYNLCEKAFFDGIKVEKANEILIAVNKYKRIAPRALKKIDYLGTIQGIMKDLSDQKFKLWVRSYAERKQISEDAARKLLLRTKKTRASPTPKNVLAEVVKDPTLSKSGIGVNKNLLNDNEFDSLMSYQVKSKFHPIGGDKGLAPHIDHEMGHMIDEAYDVGKDIELRKYYNSLKKDEIVSGLSKYGTYNYREFIAECWSEYQNNPKPREIAKTVGDRVLQLIREAT